MITTLFYSRQCPSTAGVSPPPKSSIFLCPLLSLSRTLLRLTIDGTLLFFFFFSAYAVQLERFVVVVAATAVVAVVVVVLC